MNKEVIATWNVNDIEGMITALQEARMIAATEGHHPSTVYSDKRRVTLVRETLTDGSHVMNLHFFDGA